MKAGRLLAWLVALVVAGILAVWLFKVLFFYLVAGALIAGGVYLFFRIRRAVRPGTRAQRRIAAAAETYRIRKG